MTLDREDLLVNVLVEFIRVVETSLPIDVLKALERLVEVEEGLARDIAIAMLRNAEIAKRQSIPICQDTGFLEFFVKLGLRNPYAEVLGRAILKAIEVATESIPLRPNAVNPFINTNSGNNLGRHTPWVEYIGVDSSETIDVWLYVSGGGSSSVADVRILSPVNWRRQLVEFVIDRAIRYAVNSCPPLVIGVGIGPTIEVASTLSKRALLREIGKRSEDPYAVEIEESIRDRLNSIGIGPQGLRGRTLVLDVFIEYAYRHPASCAAAVSFSCWVYRRGCLRIYPDLSFEIPTHGIGRRYGQGIQP